MPPTESSRSSESSRRAAGRRPAIDPIFPLLLLETMRDMDRPEELLEEEDVTLSMPRRFGLSDVVSVQIRRLQADVRQRRLQTVEQVEDLVRLVVRRPDAERIFAEAGRRVAHHHWRERSATVRRTVRWLPGALASLSAYRAARRMLRRLVGESALAVGRRPLELRIHRSLSARVDPSGAACAFYGAAFGELIRSYTGREHSVRHPVCEARGADGCQWVVEAAA